MTEWVRVSKRRRCPICDHADWCLIAADASAVICPRVESNKLVGDAGWLHRLDNGQPSRYVPQRVALKHRRTLPPGDLAAMARRYQAAEKLGKLNQLAEALGLSTGALARFGVGWSFRENCSTWPMCDAKGRVVGLNRRFKDGSKKIMAGHRAGLYMPAYLPEDMSGVRLPLLICEGGSDAVAAVDIGFWAVGRFSCTHGAKLLVNLVRHRQPGVVVVVQDTDEIGRRGGESLAAALLPYVAFLKVIAPPVPHKDLRAWRQAGAGIENLDRVITLAQPRRLKITLRNT